MKYIESHITDPAWNLAMEEYLFKLIPKGETCLFLWQNDNTIVVGKNQNTAGEINAEFVRQRGIHVVRRLSGGGAVYHDLGNLNFTFIADAAENTGLDFARFCMPILQTLRSYGLDAQITGRNDMTLYGKKFSGNSQYIKNGRVLHHGTILFASDMSVLTNALRVDRSKIEGKGIASVSSRVTNLCDSLPPDVTLKDFWKRLAECSGADQPFTLTEEDKTRIQKIKEERYDTWEWNYGCSPSYSATNRRRVEGCGMVEVGCQVSEGKIYDISFYGDFFGNGDLAELEDLLLGCRCRRADVLVRLERVNLSEYIHGLTPEVLAELLVPWEAEGLEMPG